MPEITNDEKEIIEQKLEYIGLDLENVPEFLKSFKPLNYRPLESYDDTYKIYKYINISAYINKSTKNNSPAIKGRAVN